MPRSTGRHTCSRLTNDGGRGKILVTFGPKGRRAHGPKTERPLEAAIRLSHLAHPQAASVRGSSLHRRRSPVLASTRAPDKPGAYHTLTMSVRLIYGLVVSLTHRAAVHVLRRERFAAVSEYRRHEMRIRVSIRPPWR